MKFDYTNEPFFLDIESGTLKNLKCVAHTSVGYDLCMVWLNKLWSHAAERIRKNVCLPSKTYCTAVYKSMPCFSNLLKSEMRLDSNNITVHEEDTMTPAPLTEDEKFAEAAYQRLLGEAYGCYLLAGGEILMVYGFHCLDDGTPTYSFNMYVYHGAMVACYVQYGEDYSYMSSTDRKSANLFRNIYGLNVFTDAKKIVSRIGYERDMFIMFERYAKIENRIVMPKVRFRAEMNSLTTDYNNTRLKIQLRNSTYFTNIIRKGDFGVRGHLRLANVKENGEWTRKLIWIDAYTKHGYTRRAAINNL